MGFRVYLGFRLAGLGFKFIGFRVYRVLGLRV